MGCFISRQREIQIDDCHLDESHSTAKSNDQCIGIETNDHYEDGYLQTIKSPPRTNDSNQGLGIQPRHFHLNISSSSSSESEELGQKPYQLVQRLGEVRVHIQISSDSSDSQYSNETSSQLPSKIICKKQTTAPDPAFLSSRRDNQSIDDVGDESVVDWLASEAGSVHTTLVSEDDCTANSPIFAFQMNSTDAPAMLTTPKRLQYSGDSMSAENNGRVQHTVKSTERVERRHVELPKDKPEVKGGNWLSHRYVVNDYIILNEIGRGAFAEVRLCKNRTTNQLFAVKIMSRKEFDPKEVAIMKKLRHPNVLQLHEVLDDLKVNKIYLIIDCLKQGDLMKLVNSRGPLSDFEVWNVTKQVVRGLNYLHQNNVVHNDLKPSNILLGEGGENHMRCVIADFGIATPRRIRIDSSGTPSYMAPEVCAGEAHDGRLADCYSLGATLYCIRIGRPPFVGRGVTKNQKLMDLHDQIKHKDLNFPVPLSNHLRHFISGLMEKDPRRRLSLSDALEHPWLQDGPMQKD